MLKRRAISIKRLFLLAMKFCKSEEDVRKIGEYLRFVSAHKNEKL